MKPWKTLAKTTVLRRGRFLTVEDHTIELPDGRILDDWPWVIVPDYVNVLPLRADGQFLCFRQTKYAAEGLTLAPVGGMIEAGEAPLEAAKRELREEMGCIAGKFILLGHYATDANRGVGTGYLYLAQQVSQVAEPDADDLEEQEIVVLRREELRAALLAGEFQIVGWAATVALALMYLDSHPLDD